MITSELLPSDLTKSNLMRLDFQALQTVQNQHEYEFSTTMDSHRQSETERLSEAMRSNYENDINKLKTELDDKVKNINNLSTIV